MSAIGIGSKEKRDYIRMDVKAEIACKVRGTNEEFMGRCTNLSHAGLQLITSKELQKGSEVDIILRISGGVSQPPLKAVLVVKRIDKEADDYIVSGVLKDVQ